MSMAANLGFTSTSGAGALIHPLQGSRENACGTSLERHWPRVTMFGSENGAGLETTFAVPPVPLSARQPFPPSSPALRQEKLSDTVRHREGERGRKQASPETSR